MQNRSRLTVLEHGIETEHKDRLSISDAAQAIKSGGEACGKAYSNGTTSGTIFSRLMSSISHHRSTAFT